MVYQIKSYIKFLFRSRNQHGVHSPFVYELITKCFYDRTHYSEYNTFNEYRKKLKKDQSKISVTDMGVGSRVFDSHQLREVRDIAQYAGIRKKRQRLLFRVAKYLKSEQSLELGTSLGLATTALSLANPSCAVTTIEACSNTSEKANSYFKDFGLRNINTVVSTFDSFLNKNSSKYDLVFIDGDHSKEGTLRYFELLRNRTYNDTLIIFDDIYWSRGMTEAWQEIIASEDVTVSIDTFFWGLAFFRKEQKKEHFVIRL